MASVRFGNRYIRSDSLILAVHQDPKAEFILRNLEVIRYTGFKGGVGLSLENTELRELGGGKVFVVERGEIESLMALKCIVGDDLREVVVMTNASEASRLNADSPLQ